MTLSRTVVRLSGLLILSTFLHQEMLSSPGAHALIPDTGSTAVRMRAQELVSGLRVLTVSLRPGDEDLLALAYLRLGAAAQVVSVSVTNGESGEHDVSGVIPRQLAADRRNATAAALARLEVDARFLNFPDPGQVGDSARAREALPPDSLRAKLGGVIAAMKPHIILLFGDRDGGGASPLWMALRSTLVDAVGRSAVRKSSASGVVQKSGERWTVSRLWVDEGSARGVAVQGTGASPVPGRSYAQIAGELEKDYVWQQVQRRGRRQQVKYTAVHSAVRKQATSFETGVDFQIPQDLRKLHAVVRSYGTEVRKRPAVRGEILRRTLRVMDSVDTAIGSTFDRTGLTMRILVDWKGALENLRNALLGVTVDYTISESILTPRQLTHVRIQSVRGPREGGTTEVYFPSAERGWILNEGIRSRLPLEVPGEYRLISPEQVTYDLPSAEYSVDQPVAVRPVMLFLLHKGKTREENFTYRLSLPVRYAPRLSAEVLTPIVRCLPGEFLVTRLTNNSRDGLRDTVAVRDSLVGARGREVRLNGKGLSQTDTLDLSWRDSIPEGTFMAPVTLGGIEVTRFAARKFEVAGDTTLSVCLLTALQASPTADALRRLGLRRVQCVRDAGELEASAVGIQVLVIDRRYTTLAQDTPLLRSRIDDLLQRGVHVLILAQDAQMWNASPLWRIVRLERDPTLAPQPPALLDTAHGVLRTPNAVTAQSFQEWVFASGYNRVTVARDSAVETPVRYDTERPLLVTARVGNGRMTYADFAFAPQWMSIHPGSFRILANLLSMRTSDEIPHQ
jgi:LmbE family N-acetylglucosaminyl deacetylase